MIPSQYHAHRFLAHVKNDLVKFQKRVQLDLFTQFNTSGT